VVAAAAAVVVAEADSAAGAAASAVAVPQAVGSALAYDSFCHATPVNLGNMTLLTKEEQRLVAQSITKAERTTDAEIVTVLSARADDYVHITLLWAALIALIVPGAINYAASWLDLHELLAVQWGLFILLALLFRIPALTTRLVPRQMRHWRAASLARRQFLEQNLHHTRGETGMLIFVSEAERYVEILVDRGISRKLPDSTWDPVIATFTAHVRRKETLQGFLKSIESCGALLAEHLPATSQRNELPNRLVVLR
jgi:putative membrane protein